MARKLIGFYVSFSGEANAGDPNPSNEINNIYALSPTGETLSKTVLDVSQQYQELRGMSFGPDGNFYVAQAHHSASTILAFSGTPPKGSLTLKYIGNFVTPGASPGLSHPYELVFDASGDLFVSSQDTNVVTAFHGPKNPSRGKAMPNSPFLQQTYPKGTFNPGTFAPAFTAKSGVPTFTAVPTGQGGLTFKLPESPAPASPTASAPGEAAGGVGRTHSVRGIAFDGAGHLYVVDEGKDRVEIFDTRGKLVGVITGSKNHSLNAPVALCFDGSKTLLIGSPGNERIFAFDVSGIAKGDFSAKTLISDPDLDKLSGIALDASGNIYTGDRKKKKIHKWSGDGASHSTFAGPFSDSPEQIIAVYSPIEGS